MIGGLGGGLAGLGAVVGGANAGTAQAADALTRLLYARQAQQDQQQQQQWQQYAGPIWQGLQRQVTGGQQATGQDIAGAQANYQPGAVQSYPPGSPQQLPQVPQFGGFPQQTSFGTGSPPQYLDGVGPGMKSGQMPWSQFAPIMQRDESGGRNVQNYRFDPGHTASGVNQITDTTWNRYAPKVGAPQLSYPASPMDRPVPEQNRVGQAIYNKEGPGPWANYNPALARDIQTKTQRISQIAGPQVAQGTQDIAHTALQTVDPATYGRQQLASMMQAIEQAAPDAPGAIKFMALGMVSKILQPADQMALRMQMQQNQQALQASIADLRSQTQLGIAQTRVEDADRRAASADQRAVTLETMREGAAAGRQERGIEAKQETGAGQPKPARFGTVDDLMSRWRDEYKGQHEGKDPTADEIAKHRSAITRETQPQPRSAPAMALRTFMDQYTEKNGHPPSADEIRNFQAGMSEATAEGRTVGTTSANMEIASNKAEALIPLLREKAGEIDLGRFPDVNSLVLAAETRTGGQTVVQYGEMVNALRYTYAQVLARGGQPRIADLEHFDEIFNKAWGKGQANAALDQIETTIARERKAVGAAKESVRTGATGAEPGQDYSKMTDQQLIELSRKQAQ